MQDIPGLINDEGRLSLGALRRTADQAAAAFNQRQTGGGHQFVTEAGGTFTPPSGSGVIGCRLQGESVSLTDGAATPIAEWGTDQDDSFFDDASFLADDVITIPQAGPYKPDTYRY